jgi:hypothetical protein
MLYSEDGLFHIRLRLLVRESDANQKASDLSAAREDENQKVLMVALWLTASVFRRPAAQPVF